MVDSSTAAEAAETEATNEHKQRGHKPEKTRAQKDAHNAACQRSRLKRKRGVEELEADYLETKKMLQKVQVEHQSMYKVMRAENQSINTKLEEKTSEVTLLKTALRILGINFTSIKELEEWIILQRYEQVGQGSGPNGTNVTASAAAGPSFVATHDHSPNNAAGILNASTAGGSFNANYALPPAFDAPNINPSSHDPAAAGTNGANITAFAAFGPSFPNHGLPNNAPENNSFSHDPAPAAGSPIASAVCSFFAADPELDIVFDDLKNLDINDLFTDDDLAAAAAGSSLIAVHKSLVMFDAPNNHDTINNHSTNDPAAGFSTASVAGSSSVANHNLHARKSYDISSLFTHHPAANNKGKEDKS